MLKSKTDKQIDIIWHGVQGVIERGGQVQSIAVGMDAFQSAIRVASALPNCRVWCLAGPTFDNQGDFFVGTHERITKVLPEGMSANVLMTWHEGKTQRLFEPVTGVA